MKLHDRDRWQSAVLGDTSITPAARIVGARLILYYNFGNGRCNPSVNRLALEVSMTTRAVEKALVQLLASGWIVSSGSRGRSSNSYSFLMEKIHAHAERRLDEETSKLHINPEPSVGVTPNNGSLEPRTVVRTNREKNREEEQGGIPPTPILEISGSSQTSDPAEQVGNFEAFWRQYPHVSERQFAKEPARDAYEQALRTGAKASDIQAGAMRYAAERMDQNARYTTRPKTWLGEQRWTEVTPPAEPAPVARHRKGDRLHGTLGRALMRHGLIRQQEDEDDIGQREDRFAPRPSER